MGQITSSVGLVSGINTGLIINELISLDAQPITLLQNRVASSQAQSQAYQALGIQLTTLQQLGQSLELPTTFANSAATSSNQNVLTATAGVGAAVGSYSFDVASLVTSQQAISSGYASANSLVGAGTLTISQGGGEASSQTTLAQLNGGAGVSRGQFRITDGGGNSSVIDTSTAVTLDDVVTKINTSLNISVRASIKDDHLVLKDTSGQTKTPFSIADLGSGTTAANLGIVASTTGTTVTGTSINTLSVGTSVSQLNDGRGIGTAGGAPDFQIGLADGTNLSVSINGAQTIGDVLAAINKIGGAKLKATIDPANNAIKLTDTSGGSGGLSVTAQNNSTAAKDLGILGAAAGTGIQGKTLLGSLDSVLISSLNGGNGLALGTIHIVDRAGGAANVNLTGAKSLQDIFNGINSAGLTVTASLNKAGDGIQLQDTSSAGGNLVVSDSGSTTATLLGIAGTYDTTKPTVTGANLHTQYVSNSTLLSNYNGGNGVQPGTFTITNSKGVSSTVDLSGGTFTTIGEVIAAINAKQVGVNASINANGDGILLTDSAGGGSNLKVADVSGTTAANLNIAGTATTTTLDGSFTKSVAVTASDTLTTLQQKIQSLGFGVAANIVNDGSGNNSYHLSLTALNSGRNGRVVIDAGTTNLNTQNIVNAQDAAVFFGGANSSASLLITSSSNQVSKVIAGVTIQLQGTGTSTLNVTRDSSNISAKLQTFTDTFNGLVDEINTLTQWNTTTNQGGLLLGDSTVSDIQIQLYDVFNSVVKGAGQFKVFSDVGLSISSGAKLTFDATKFSSAYGTDPTAVQNLFTQTQSGIGSLIDKGMNRLIDPVNGELTRQETTIAAQVTQFQGSITDLNALLSQKKSYLTQEFANMETVLSGLQSQQATLGSITPITVTPTTSSKATSSAA